MPNNVTAAYGDAVPFCDPSWYQEWSSPYYTESHVKFRAKVRQFVDTELTPNCHEWEENKKMPHEIFAKAFKAGWLPCVVKILAW